MPLSSFSPRTREWFERAFAAPTPAQAQAWPAIAGGEHVLVSAPTGSGKTLAAFLWALDRLSSSTVPALGGDDGAGDGSNGAGGARADCVAPGAGTRVVYVSPLKALAYDIERNLRAPLRGIGANEVTVGIRTGDTPQRERAAMVRNPPDILVTTPESLYLILTSQARSMLAGVEAVIVDEIHAVAHSKRGAHLALTLERLEAHVRSHRPLGAAGTATQVQRIGLSATQSPLEEIGRFLVGPHRAGHDRQRRRAQATRPAHRGAGRVHDRARRPEGGGRTGSKPHRPRRGIRWSPSPAASPREARSGRPSTPSCWSSSRSTTPPSCSSTTAAPPSASRCA